MGLKLPEGLEIHNARLSERNAAYAEFLYRAHAAPRPAVPRLPAPGQPGPQRVRRLHGRRMATPTPWSPGLTRNYISRAARRAQGDRPQARRAPVRPDHDGRARPHGVHRRHRGARAADLGRARRHRDPDRARRAPHGLHAARGVPVVLDLRQPAGREGDARPGRGRGARPARRSTSSTTARCRPTSRSTPSCWRSTRSAACRRPPTC